jgi:endo-1,4-beta-xylanase
MGKSKKQQKWHWRKETNIKLLAALVAFLMVFGIHLTLTPAQEIILPKQQSTDTNPIIQASSDSGWREVATENIEKYRKGDLTVLVTDANGNPVPNADVRVAMKRHAYSFGTAIDSKLLLDSSHPDRDNYRNNILQLFNEAVPENILKWQNWERLELRPQAIETVKWLRNNNLKVRGHNLIWPNWNFVPSELQTLYNNKRVQEGKAAADEFLSTRIINHIREEASYFQGQIPEWDVVNEPCDNRDFQTLLGESALVDWFNAAHQGDPNAVLYVNQNLYESSIKADEYESVIQYLLNNGAPLGGIGIEGHTFDLDKFSIPQFLSTLDRFAKFNLPIKITEFDFLTRDKQLQAEITRDIMIATFSHPATVGFVMWGFWDGKHWLSNGPVYDMDWNLKQSGEAYIDLVFNQWWTNVVGKTDANGEYKVRGFLGDYEVTASKDQVRQTVSATLSRNGTRLIINNMTS